MHVMFLFSANVTFSCDVLWRFTSQNVTLCICFVRFPVRFCETSKTQYFSCFLTNSGWILTFLLSRFRKTSVFFNNEDVSLLNTIVIALFSMISNSFVWRFVRFFWRYFGSWFSNWSGKYIFFLFWYDYCCYSYSVIPK